MRLQPLVVKRVGLFLGPATPFGAEGINAYIEHQALIASYTNDFLLIFWICLPVLPLLFLMRRPRKQPVAVSQAAME